MGLFPKAWALSLPFAIALILLQLATQASRSELVAWGGNTFGQTNVPKGLSNIVQIAAGESIGLALTADGRVFSWGNNWPAPPSLTNIVAVACGYKLNVALTRQGKVIQWGPPPLAPVPSVPLAASNVVAISTSGDRSLAITPSGNVIEWLRSKVSVLPAGLENVVSVAAGGDFSLALTSRGSLIAWGDNKWGQTSVPTNLANVVAIAAGPTHALALTRDGFVVGWGNNQWGQTSIPSDLSGVVAISTATYQSMALTQDGRLIRWGGLGKYPELETPIGLENVVAMAAGGTWGLALVGEAPNSEPPRLLGPFSLIGTGGRPFFARLMGSDRNLTYAATGLPAGLSLSESTGAISGIPEVVGSFTVGVSVKSPQGEGNQSITISINVPAMSFTNLNAFPLFRGDYVSFGTTRNADQTFATGLPEGLQLNPQTGVVQGRALQAGDFPISLVASNRFGVITTTFTNQVRALVGWGDIRWESQVRFPTDLADPIDIAVGNTIGFALLGNGRVIGWGTSYRTNSSIPPDLKEVVAITAGGYQGLALTADGRVIGLNSRSTPPNLTNIVAISTASERNLALRRDGQVLEWIDYSASQAPGSPPSVPKILPGVSNVVAVAAGLEQGLAITSLGEVVNWAGTNFERVAVPAGLSNVVGIAAGISNRIALTAQGKALFWGGKLTRLTEVWTNIESVVASDSYTLALTGGGTLRDRDEAFIFPNFNYEGPSGWLSNNLVMVATHRTRSLASIGLPPGFRPPIFFGNRVLIGTEGRRMWWKPKTANGVDSFCFEGLPAGLEGDSRSGIISGIPFAPGAYDCTLYASNVAGVSSNQLILHINTPLPGSILPPLLPVQFGKPLSLSIGAVNAEQTKVSGLPPGLAYDPNTMTIIGRPLQAGDFACTVEVGNRHLTNRFNSTMRVSQVVEWGSSYDIFSNVISNVIPKMKDVVGLVKKSLYTLAINADGTVLGWGLDDLRTLVPPPNLSNMVSVATGGSQGLGLMENGDVVAWGNINLLEARVPAGLSNVVAIAAGTYHNLALTDDGRVVAWGQNNLGQLNMPKGLSNIVAVAAGYGHSLALSIKGDVFSWGRNDLGQTNVPKGLRNVVAIAANGDHNLVLMADGTLNAWGSGNGRPVTLPQGVFTAVGIAAGNAHSLARLKQGDIVGWDGVGGAGETLPPSYVANAGLIVAGNSVSSALLPKPDLCFSDRRVDLGAPLTLAASAYVGQPSRYAWHRDGVQVSKAHVLRFSAVQASDLGTYTAVSTFKFGKVTNAVIRITLGSDLEPTQISTPPEAALGSIHLISWTVTNRGALASTGNWVDRVYLTEDPSLINGRLLAEVPFTRTLAPRESVVITAKINIPADLPLDRPYWWAVVTDAGGALVEVSDWNNTRLSTLPVALRPATVIRLTSSLEPDGQGLSLGFLREAFKSYTLEYTDDLNSPSWTPLQRLDAMPQSADYRQTVPVQDIANRFYRITSP